MAQGFVDRGSDNVVPKGLPIFYILTDFIFRLRICSIKSLKTVQTSNILIHSWQVTSKEHGAIKDTSVLVLIYFRKNIHSVKLLYTFTQPNIDSTFTNENVHGDDMNYGMNDI